MPGQIRYDLPPAGFQSGVDGDVWNRQWHCYDLDGLDIPSLIVEIFTLTHPIGTPAPAPLLGTQKVRQISIDRITLDTDTGKSQAWGVEIYATPTRSSRVPDANGPGTVRTSTAGVLRIQTDLDDGGAQIQTTHDGATMAHVVDGFEVLRTFTFSRPEDVDPRGRNDAYVGKLNAGTWNGYSDRTVLLANLDADQADDSPGTWEAVYTFQVRDSWEERAVHDDPFFPGKPLPNPLPGEFWTGHSIPAVSFAGLNISL